MNRAWVLILAFGLLVCVASNSLAAYGIGDVVSNYTWKESDGGTPVDNSIQGVIDSGNVLIIEFGATW